MQRSTPKLTYPSYNAAIFKIIAKSAYSTILMDSTSPEYNFIKNSRTAIRLENSQWKEIYGDGYVSRYGDLYLGVDGVAYHLATSSSSRIPSMAEFLPSNITGGNSGTWSAPTAEGWASSTWLPIGREANLSRPHQIHFSEGFTGDTGLTSRIQINLYFMVVVLVFNFFKVGVMLGTLIIDRSDYVVTLGDAVASFLERPEDLTEGKCTLETDNLFASYGSPEQMDEMTVIKGGISEQGMSGTWRPRPRRYCSSIGFDKAWSATIS
jgi:hypothetical protein